MFTVKAWMRVNNPGCAGGLVRSISDWKVRYSVGIDFSRLKTQIHIVN